MRPLQSNGEKASPAPLEAVIRKSSLVKEALVFGVNRSSLGVAVIPHKGGVTAQDVWPTVQEANKIAPAHAQIPPELVLVLPEDATFPKASKGTIQRGKAYEAHEATIDCVYKRYENSDASIGMQGKLQLAPSELLDYILDRIKEVMQVKEVQADDDLFNLGLNSTQALRVRNILRTVCVCGLQRLLLLILISLHSCVPEIGPGIQSQFAPEHRLRMLHSTSVGTVLLIGYRAHVEHNTLSAAWQIISLIKARALKPKTKTYT